MLHPVIVRASLLFIALSVAIACTNVRTRYDFDPAVDFSAWRTYAWYPIGSPPTGDPRRDNPLLHRRIEAAVDRELAAKGFEKISEGDPDFFVNFHLATERRLDVRHMNGVYADGPRGRQWNGAGWGGVRWSEVVVTEYQEGTLVLDLVDEFERVLAWRGSGSRRLPRDLPPDRLTRFVDEAVDEILRQFPPTR
jgi:hypothetical protein